ncbi:MAG: ABC transporter permease [Planctomycetota bacterium]
MRGRSERLREWLVSLPSLVWLTLFFVVPTLIVFALAFRPADLHGGIGGGWTFENVRSLWQPPFAVIAWRTVRLSLVTTALCLLLAVPCGIFIARSPRRWRRCLLLLVIVPFWTSFLIRVFAWRVLLHPEGIVKRLLQFLGLAGPDAVLLYNEPAVLLGMVYTYLPFAILPIYAAAERFDYCLVEAARDLGAGRLRAFFEVFVPGIRRGLGAAVLLVLIPALGTYVIPDLLGGPGTEMIGTKIAQRAFADRHLPQASAVAAALVLALLVPLIAVIVLQRRRGRELEVPRGVP